MLSAGCVKREYTLGSAWDDIKLKFDEKMSINLKPSDKMKKATSDITIHSKDIAEEFKNLDTLENLGLV